MKKQDIALALFSGAGTAFLFSKIIGGLAQKNVFLADNLQMLTIVLYVGLPLGAVFAIWLADFLGRKYLFIYQAAKFLLIGILATLMDSGVLALLQLLVVADTKTIYAIIKGISFVVVTTVKYPLNKYLAFEQKEKAGMGREFSIFFIVTAIGLAIDVAIATMTKSAISADIGLSENMRGIVGAIVASIIVSIWNFIGYKFIVFKK